MLDFVQVLDVGYGRVWMHPGTGFTLSLMKYDEARGGPFTELTTGLDHLGLGAASRDELEEWERRFEEHGVTVHADPGHGVRLPPELPGPGQHRARAVSTERPDAGRP